MPDHPLFFFRTIVADSLKKGGNMKEKVAEKKANLPFNQAFNKVQSCGANLKPRAIIQRNLTVHDILHHLCHSLVLHLFICIPESPQ